MKHAEPSFWRTPSGWIALVLIAFAVYFYLMEHREHVFAFLPFAIILLCPVMHIFMHRGHGHHHDHDGSAKSAQHKESHHDH